MFATGPDAARQWTGCWPWKSVGVLLLKELGGVRWSDLILSENIKVMSLNRAPLPFPDKVEF